MSTIKYITIKNTVDTLLQKTTKQGLANLHKILLEIEFVSPQINNYMKAVVQKNNFFKSTGSFEFYTARSLNALIYEYNATNKSILST